MISARYAPAVAALLVVVLIPTLVHSYLGVRRDDGRRVAALPALLGGMTCIATDRDAGWGARRFDSQDWIERECSVPGRSQRLRLFVGRSYDAKKLYHHPEIDLARGMTYAPARVTGISDLAGVPVHELRGENGQALALYVLGHDNEFVGDPYLFQLRIAFGLLVGGRQPMTIFFVRDDAATGEQLDGTPAARLLAATVAEFGTQAVGKAVARE